MGRRSIIRNWEAVSNENIVAGVESKPIDAAFLDKGRAHVAWEGATDGSALLFVEISNDERIWRRLNNEGIPLALGDSGETEGTHEIIFSQLDFGYMLFYVDPQTETTGTIDINFSASTEGR